MTYGIKYIVLFLNFTVDKRLMFREIFVAAALLFVSTAYCTVEEYLFTGNHFIASYSDCDEMALSDVNTLIDVMKVAVEKSGATILDYCFYEFPGGGLTLALLLSESHASIHTYPEHNACFIDLFTCGDDCSYEEFHTFLLGYLKPDFVDVKVLARKQTTEEVCL